MFISLLFNDSCSCFSHFDRREKSRSAEEERRFMPGALATKVKNSRSVAGYNERLRFVHVAGFKLQVLIMYSGRSKIQEFADDSDLDVRCTSLIIVH